MSEKRDIQISKALSYLLRHGAAKEKLPIDEQGYVKLSTILSNNRIKTHRATKQDIERIVETNNKKRFTLISRDDGTYICANQGHSLKTINNDNLQKLEEPKDFPSQLIHGTTLPKLKLILESGGLSKMNRNHIHFTSNLTNDDANGVVTGIRYNSNILIYLDITKLQNQDEIQFYKSLNDVYLTPGDSNGVLSKEFFLKIVDRKTGQLVI